MNSPPAPFARTSEPEKLIADITPTVLRNGQQFSIQFLNGEDLLGEELSISLCGSDSLQECWRLSFAVRHSEEGAQYVCPIHLTTSRETAIWVERLTVTSTNKDIHPTTLAVAIVNPSDDLAEEDVLSRFYSIARDRDRRYRRCLGHDTDDSSIKYSVLFIVEGLLITQRFWLPGLRMEPLPGRPKGEDSRRLLELGLEMLEWPSSVSESTWTQQNYAELPCMLVTFPEVIAQSPGEAGRIAAHRLERTLALFSLSRGAKGRILAAAVSEDTQENKVYCKPWVPTYYGNFAVGIAAGEDQVSLARQDYALDQDPLLDLCVALYGEALADPSIDGKYFRYWSLLETLALNRVDPGLAVLVDGKPWPNGSTTAHAAPRVFRLICPSGVEGGAAGASADSPSPYSLVRVCYARRNATVHYGRFDPSSSMQQAAGWYEHAAQSLNGTEEDHRWHTRLRDVTAGVLIREMADLSSGAEGFSR